MAPPFSDVLLSGEEDLLARILADAEANGHFGSVPPDPEAWRPAVRGITGSIVQAFRNSEAPSPLDAGEMGKEDALSAFLVVEARQLRLAGMSLGSFLGLAKLIRRAYLDRVRSAGYLPNEEARYRLFVERFFDRNEAAVCVSWAAESAREQEERIIGMRDELARVHALVAAAKEELEGTLDCLDIMILLVDANGRILRCNYAFRSFVGKPFAEILGRPLAKVLEEGGIPGGLRPGEAVEHYHERQDRWFVLRPYPFRQDPDMEPSGTIVTIRDTTAVKAVTAELERGASELQRTLSNLRRTHARLLEKEKATAVGKMAEGVARDIGRPIGVVASNMATLWKRLPRLAGFLEEQSSCIAAGSPPHLVEALLRKREELGLDYILEDFRDLVGETLEEAERLRAIAGELKDYSRPEESEFREADLNRCLRDALRRARKELDGKATVDCSLGNIPPTRCAPSHMTRAFADLLSEAARAARPDAVLEVRSWTEDGYVCVSFGDARREIPGDRLDRVFDPYPGSGGNGVDGGAGLGAAYGILRNHQGEIRVRSGNGEGTTFTVRVPLVKEG